MESQVSITPFSFSMRTEVDAVVLSRATLYKYIQAGDMETFKVGTKTLIRADELSRFIDTLSGVKS